MRGYSSLPKQTVVVHDGDSRLEIIATVYQSKNAPFCIARYQKMYRVVRFDASDGCYHMRIDTTSLPVIQCSSAELQARVDGLLGKLEKKRG